MTEKQKKDEILLALYPYRNEKIIEDIDELLFKNNIPISNDTEKLRLFEALNVDELITFKSWRTLMITSKGVEYVELHILPEKERTKGFDQAIQDSLDDLKQNTSEAKSDNTKNLLSNPDEFNTHYRPIPFDEPIKDKGIEECFDVKKLASAFVYLLDKMQHNDSQMIGIFGAWGRGKTYFFDKVKQMLNSKKEDIEYDVVTFNAWKYQETPAIWAYLFEAMFTKYEGWGKKSLYTLYRHWKNNWRNALLSLCVIICIVTLYCVLKNTDSGEIGLWINEYLSTLGVSIATIIASIVILLKSLIGKPLSAFNLIKKYTKQLSFNNVLGIQAEIEKEIESLLKCWITTKENSKKRKKKVLLFIDDIDRCSEHKIISIIDALRTILENENICKRMMIVCAIDEQKLMLAIKHKYRELYPKDSDEGELKKLIREQMDKIFLSGIKLKPISQNEQIEYIKNL